MVIKRFRVGAHRVSVVSFGASFAVNFSRSLFAAPSASWRFSSYQSALDFARFLISNKKLLKELKK